MEKSSTTIGRIRFKDKDLFIQELCTSIEEVSKLHAAAWDELSKPQYERKFIWTRLRFELIEKPRNLLVIDRILENSSEFINVARSIINLSKLSDDIYLSKEDLEIIQRKTSIVLMLKAFATPREN